MAKLRFTLTFEYEADPYQYDTDDPELMAEIDQDNFRPEELDEFLGDAEWVCKIEPVQDSKRA